MSPRDLKLTFYLSPSVAYYDITIGVGPETQVCGGAQVVPHLTLDEKKHDIMEKEPMFYSMTGEGKW